MKSLMISSVNKILGREQRIITLNLTKIGDAGFNSDPDIAYDILKAMYDTILKDDENWHLFYEGYWLSTLRVSEPYYDKVKKFLNNNDVHYTDKGEWKDDSELVQKYKHIFKPLFHQFSEIGMLEYYDGNNYYGRNGGFALLDRVLHCFVNHQYYAMRDFVKGSPSTWEPKILTDNALLRAKYVGRCEGIHEGYNKGYSKASKVNEKSEGNED